MKSKYSTIVKILALISIPHYVIAQQNTSSCSEQEEFHLLDFWVGSWDVYAGDKKSAPTKSKIFWLAAPSSKAGSDAVVMKGKAFSTTIQKKSTGNRCG